MKHRKQRRRVRAAKRQALRNARGIDDQLREIALRPGLSRRETDRLREQRALAQLFRDHIITYVQQRMDENAALTNMRMLQKEVETK